MMNKDEAAFLSTIEFYRDSLLTHSNLPAREVRMKYSTENSFFIQTSLKSQSTIYSDRVSDAKFKYSETHNFDWKLVDGTKMIGGILCNKATLNAFGRQWEAWYSKEHPFFFGPYKFYGLPGLIIEIYDITNSYHFTLFALKKDRLFYEDIHKDSKMISKNEMLKAKKSSQQYHMIFRNITFTDPKMEKDMREWMEEKEKKKNNPLELKP